jgi:hypothetical protein
MNNDVALRLQIVELDLSRLFSHCGLVRTTYQGGDDDDTNPEMRKRFCPSMACPPPSSNHSDECKLDQQCRDVVEDLVAKIAKLETYVTDMLKTIYGQGGLDLAINGQTPQHCGAAADGSQDIRTPKYGLISDGEQTWQITRDHSKTLRDTKYYCGEMQQRLDFWTPFLEGLYDQCGAQAKAMQERGEEINKERRLIRMEQRSANAEDEDI